jgi:hypothetical protein
MTPRFYATPSHFQISHFPQSVCRIPPPPARWHHHEVIKIQQQHIRQGEAPSEPPLDSHRNANVPTGGKPARDRTPKAASPLGSGTDQYPKRAGANETSFYPTHPLGSRWYCLERPSLVLFQAPNDRGFSWAIRGPALFLREEVGAPLDRDVTSVFRCSPPCSRRNGR